MEPVIKVVDIVKTIEKGLPYVQSQTAGRYDGEFYKLIGLIGLLESKLNIANANLVNANDIQNWLDVLKEKFGIDKNPATLSLTVTDVTVLQDKRFGIITKKLNQAVERYRAIASDPKITSIYHIRFDKKIFLDPTNSICEQYLKTLTTLTDNFSSITEHNADNIARFFTDITRLNINMLEQPTSVFKKCSSFIYKKKID